MAQRMNWDKAQRDSERARGIREGVAKRRSGQRSRIKTDVRPATPKQLAYIKTLQSLTGTIEPMPRTAWQASGLIDHLRKIKQQQDRRV